MSKTQDVVIVLNSFPMRKDINPMYGDDLLQSPSAITNMIAENPSMLNENTS
jgi:hypothetical protein